MAKKFKYLGNPNAAAGVGIDIDHGMHRRDVLDTFEAPDVQEVTLTSKELTAYCPVTERPHFYELTLKYVPYKRCLEGESFKVYLELFRCVHTFGETLAAVIAEEVMQVLEAETVTVILVRNVGSGVRIKTKAVRHGKERDVPEDTFIM